MVASRIQYPWHTFPHQLDRVEELPATLARVAGEALPGDARLDFIFLAPANTYSKSRFISHVVPEQALLFTADGVLHVQAAAVGKPALTATYYRAADLLYLQTGLLLLYGRIELAGLVDGALARSVIEYSTTGWELVQPHLLRLARLAAGCGDGGTAPGSLAGRESLETLIQPLPYKFANGLRLLGVQPGETLLGVTFQPDLWDEHLTIFRRQITPATALALTDRCVVLLAEDAAVTKKAAAYAWEFTFIPRIAIAGVQTEPAGTRQALTISMRRGPAAAERRLILEAGLAEEWCRLWDSR